MIVREPYQLPQDKREFHRRAVRLEWISIFFLATIATAMYLAMGSSQAMKAAWIEDLLSFIPPFVFLLSAHYSRRKPDIDFPYGYWRLSAIAFVCAAVALTALGGFILYDSLHQLISMEHPTIGTITIFGRDLWAGWVMVAALIYSVIPTVILGRLKLKPANSLSDKTLFADASMNKADWKTGLAGVFGIVAVGYGLWWADAAAAGFISFEILRDGLRHLKSSVSDLLDHIPTSISHEGRSEIVQRVRGSLKELDWVRDADVRLREEGDLVVGEAYVVPINDENLIGRGKQARDAAENCDWRVYDVVITMTDNLNLSQSED